MQDFGRNKCTDMKFSNKVYPCFLWKTTAVPFILLLILSGLQAQGQNGNSSDSSKDRVYLELLGNAGAYSINYERSLSQSFHARIGVGNTSSNDLFGAGTNIVTTFPIMGNFLFRGGNNKLELGTGILVGWSSFDSSFGDENDRSTTILDLVGVAGYRYQRDNGGFIFRAGITPFLALSGGDDAYPEPGLSLSAGLSFGYGF